ncbi:hypothetical protein CORC01_10455 [Colletotrichum orchidophilum]|uniref:Wax synthase domain-containing protein n=1 Tax=Colletotrichum orchidophilum TaxID=1209926 RepID=A0A1G4AYX1_9PEZI|nr:uncharacterized protein CORC01_10455 [Colletotrichum orchidophilum]OHE94295.1 hypothetical protein CORC01_10455 [Colletotrichum orchidophilum]
MDIRPPALEELANPWNHNALEWNWTDTDWNYVYGEPIRIWEALVNHIFWDAWEEIQMIQTDLLFYPALIYLLNLTCLATAFNTKGRYRTAFVGASIAVAAGIIQQLSILPLFYPVKITTIQVLVIQNMGAAVMLLWEGIAVTEEQKKLPWRHRLLATYKLLWNARYINTPRPAPVLHLVKAEDDVRGQLEEATNKAKIDDAAVQKDAADDKKRDMALKEATDNRDLTEGIKYFRSLERQTSRHTWRKVSQPVARFWNSFSPRNRWIMTTVAKITLIFVLERIMDYLWNTYASYTHDDFALYKRSYFRRLIRNEVEPREFMIRCYFAFEGIWRAFHWYTILHSTVALFFVALHIDEPEEWPPVFGDIREGWNLRRFWSKYFDRLIYRTTNGIGEMILTVVGAGQRPFRGKKRWLLNGLIFFMSGIFHAGTEYVSGLECHVVWEIWWWMLNYFAMIAETAFMYGLQTYFPRFYDKTSGKIGKTIGYLWLFAFMFYSSPKNLYTALNCMPPF